MGARPPLQEPERPGLGGQGWTWRNLIVACTLSLLVLAGLVAATWDRDSYRALSGLHGRALGAALAALAASWALNTLRAWMVARVLGHPVAGRVAFRAVMAGAYVAALTPFAGGGGAAEALVLAQGGLPYPLALAGVTASGVIAQAVLLAGTAVALLSPLPLPGVPVLRMVARWLWAPYALALAGVAAALMRLELLAGPVDRLLGWLERLWPRAARRLAGWRAKSRSFLVSTAQGVRTLLQARPGVVVALAVLYVGYYGAIFSVAPLIGIPMGLELSPAAILVAQFPLFLLAGAMPTPGASGAMEAAMAALVAPHLPLAAVGVFVTAWRALTLYPAMAVGAMAAVSTLRSLGQAGSQPGRLHSPA